MVVPRTPSILNTMAPSTGTVETIGVSQVKICV